jgi:hypothetical protein
VTRPWTAGPGGRASARSPGTTDSDSTAGPEELRLRRHGRRASARPPGTVQALGSTDRRRNRRRRADAPRCDGTAEPGPGRRPKERRPGLSRRAGFGLLAAGEGVVGVASSGRRPVGGKPRFGVADRRHGPAAARDRRTDHDRSGSRASARRTGRTGPDRRRRARTAAARCQGWTSVRRRRDGRGRGAGTDGVCGRQQPVLRHGRRPADRPGLPRRRKGGAAGRSDAQASRSRVGDPVPTASRRNGDATDLGRRCGPNRTLAGGQQPDGGRHRLRSVAAAGSSCNASRMDDRRRRGCNGKASASCSEANSGLRPVSRGRSG